MMLVLSILVGIIPLLGIVWILTTGTITTVDGLFFSLILLTLSGILMLNAFLEARARGYLSLLRREKTETPQQAKAPVQKTAVAKQPQQAGTAAQTPQAAETPQAPKAG